MKRCCYIQVELVKVTFLRRSLNKTDSTNMSLERLQQEIQNKLDKLKLEEVNLFYFMFKIFSCTCSILGTSTI